MRSLLFLAILALPLSAQEPAQVKGKPAYLTINADNQNFDIYVGPTARVGNDATSKGIKATIYDQATPIFELQFPGKEKGSYPIKKGTELILTHPALKGTLKTGSITITLIEKTALQGSFTGTLKTDNGDKPIKGNFLFPAYIR